MSQVYVVICNQENLQQMIQEEKDNGRRILAIASTKLKKPARKNEFEVTEFKLFTQ